MHEYPLKIQQQLNPAHNRTLTAIPRGRFGLNAKSVHFLHM